MKLVRCGASLLVFAAGCASSPAVTTAPVATTRVNAATIERDDTPRVGKAQRSAKASDESEAVDAPKEPRRDDGRRGSGFTGWK